jgi:hypothetical protein
MGLFAVPATVASINAKMGDAGNPAGRGVGAQMGRRVFVDTSNIDIQQQ